MRTMPSAAAGRTMRRRTTMIEPERYELSGAAAATRSSWSAATSCGCFGGGLVVMVAARAIVLAQESGRGGRRDAPTSRSSRPGCTSTSGARHGVHRQDRDRPEHPHVARADDRRRAAAADRRDLDGDGGHRPDAVRRRHVRIADHAADGAAAGARRGDRARDADRSGRRALAGRSRDARPRATAGLSRPTAGRCRTAS